MANIAHEFRTPLLALAASVELLLDQPPDLSSDELRELLISLHLGILGLQTLVDNLLVLSKRSQRLVVELPAAIPVVRPIPAGQSRF